MINSQKPSVYNFQLSNQILGNLASAGFLAMLFINMLTYFNLPYLSELADWYFISFAICIPPFGAFVITISRQKKATSIYTEENFSISEIMDRLPNWLNSLIIIVIIYVAYNFINCFSLVKGQAIIEDGNFAINDRGSITYVNHAYYIQHRLYEIRLWSGGLLVFYLIPAVYYLFYLRLEKRDVSKT